MAGQSLVLDYHKQMFAEIFADDGLLIAGRGLGLHQVLLSLLHVYCDPQALVFLINCSAKEEALLFEELSAEGVAPLPNIINNEYTSADREALYRGGGVMCVTSRILIVDLLNKRIPFHLISGILVNNAHRVSDTSTEAFILRLYRQHNKKGFIKGLSEAPEAFAAGFSTTEKVMRNLYATRLFLWPRFRAEVVATLDRHQPDVVELLQPMTPLMTDVQRAVVQVMDACLAELRKTNKVDIGEVTVESSLFRNFETILRRQLDPVWHNLSRTTKALVADLKTLRELLNYLLTYDCVAYNEQLESTRAADGVLGQHSVWMFADGAANIFSGAKDRVFTTRRKEGVADTDPGPKYEVVPVLEENPKWSLLVDVLKEIEHANDDLVAKGLPHGRILILVQDVRTVRQLQEYLMTGGEMMLRGMFERYWQRRKERSAAAAAAGFTAHGNAYLSSNKPQYKRGTGWSKGGYAKSRNRARARGRGAKTAAASPRPDSPAVSAGEGGAGAASAGAGAAAKGDLPELLDDSLEKILPAEFEEDDDGLVGGLRTDSYFNRRFDHMTDEEKYESIDDTIFEANFGMLAAPYIMIHPIQNENLVLERLAPTFVVVYDPDMALVRQLEVYKAQHPGVPLRVYFLMYQESVEQQRYLSALKREKESFEKLIFTKERMVIPEDQDGRGDAPPLEAVPLSVTTSRALKRMRSQVPTIVVDVREFRSSLPSMLHERGIQVEPMTLEVGDYILSDQICVERKSISDLFGSFASGRLYIQAEQMCRYYAHPVLLIEFDTDRSFSLQSKYDLTGEVSPNNIISKLSLLILHFPRLHILWSRSPYITAEMFEGLKVNQTEPDAQKAAMVGIENPEHADELYNVTPQDMLRTLPGITPDNIRNVMHNVENLSELSRMTVAQLTKLIGDVNATKLHAFFHKTGGLETLR